MELSIRTKKDVIKRLKDLRSDMKELGVKRLGLFGSYVREAQHAESDIDILVEFESGKKTADNFMRLSFLLEEKLGHPVELVTIEALSPYLSSQILEEAEYVTDSN